MVILGLIRIWSHAILLEAAVDASKHEPSLSNDIAIR